MKVFDIIKQGNDDKDIFGKVTPTINELAKKFGVSTNDVLTQVKKGIKVEKEHTSEDKYALEIALDHISEDLYYYDKLATIEKH